MEKQVIQTDWTAIIVIIGSILVPMVTAFGWILHQISELKTRTAIIQTRMGFIERLLEIIGFSLKTNKERTDP